jgi:hypothetical protein
MSEPIIIEDSPVVEREDRGDILILTLYNVKDDVYQNPFVKIQSYFEKEDLTAHSELEPLIGKNLRVTIEILD